ncbi:MAG: GNAT family N-acetyltransferase [Sedimenticola sp.]
MDALSLRRLDPEHARPAFDCGDSDLNEFFRTDSIASGKELVAVTYTLEQNAETIGFISVSNDSLKEEYLTKSRWKKILKGIPRAKRYRSMPAVKIGRLAISENSAGVGIGTALLDFVKVWFTEGNKTGCRFIIVDAYNKERTISFYQKNGFDFLITDDGTDETRLMYFDLLTFRE